MNRDTETVSYTHLLRKEFALLHMRRYQTDELSAALRSVGWGTVARLVIEGNPKEATDALMLFQRMRRQ